MHLTALPVLLPFLGAVIVLIPWFNKRIAQQRLVAQLFLLGTLAVSIVLLTQTMAEGAQGYAMGEWANGKRLLVSSLSRIHWLASCLY